MRKTNACARLAEIHAAPTTTATIATVPPITERSKADVAVVAIVAGGRSVNPQSPFPTETAKCTRAGREVSTTAWVQMWAVMARLTGPSETLTYMSTQQPEVTGEQPLPELRLAPCTEVRVGAGSRRQLGEVRISSKSQK